MVIRIGRGVPGRRRIPGWADFVAHCCQLVLLATLLGVALWPVVPFEDVPRWIFETSAR